MIILIADSVQILIHFNCTTGLEALLLNKEV